MLMTFSRYLAVQGLAYAIDMGGFVLLTWATGVSPVAANIAGKLAAGAFAFLAHRRFTFGVHGEGDGRTQLLKYSLLLAANIPLSSALLTWLLYWIDLPIAAKFASDTFCVALTFALSRTMVFRAPKRTSSR